MEVKSVPSDKVLFFEVECIVQQLKRGLKGRPLQITVTYSGSVRGVVSLGSVGPAAL